MATTSEISGPRLLRATRALHIYIWVVMAGLLVQGGGSLILRLWPQLEPYTPLPVATLMNGNLPHAILHVVWGATGLLIMATQRTNRARLALGLTFGAFYTALGFLGIAVHNPFGLRLAWEENTFHLTVGPLMLALALLAWRAPEAVLWVRRPARQ
jgi:hypothetical protein